jgi:hypothetical protein
MLGMRRTKTKTNLFQQVVQPQINPQCVAVRVAINTKITFSSPLEPSWGSKVAGLKDVGSSVVAFVESARKCDHKVAHRLGNL